MRSSSRAGLLAVALIVVSWTPSARADGPTSGDLSVIGGRTMGSGEISVAAGAGWPGTWGQIQFAPRSTLNVGVRATVLYGSPILGFGTGIGGEVSMPVRKHLLGKGRWDLAMTARPLVITGRAALVGAEDSLFEDDFGWAALFEKGLVAGWQATDAVTLVMGVMTTSGAVGIPEANRTRFAFQALGVLGLELLLGRDTLLFLQVEGGGGTSGSEVFPHQGIVRAHVGFARML
jgi:hypothetical protein